MLTYVKVTLMNQTVCLYNPESKIITGNQFMAKNVFNEIRTESILRVHSEGFYNECWGNVKNKNALS